jgi:hypothetical protein
MKNPGEFSITVTLAYFTELTWGWYIAPPRHRLRMKKSCQSLGHSLPATREILHIYEVQRYFYRVHTRPPLDSARGQLNPGQTYRSYFFKIWFNTIILYMPRSFKAHLSFTLQNVNLTHVSHPTSILIRFSNLIRLGARGSVVGWYTMLHAGRSRVLFPMLLDFSFEVILPAALWRWGRLSL